jgi:hypothetical protein
MTPTIANKYLHETQSGYAGVERRYRGRGGMSPKIIVLHIQEGSSWGSWTWFHQVSASSTIFANKNGSIWNLVPEGDAPWTNGDVKSPSAKAVAVMNKFGWDPNYYTLSIETEGFTGEWPKAQAQLDAVVWQIKTWMRKYNIPKEMIFRHADFNSVSRSRCPGDAFFNYVMKALDGTEVPTHAVVVSPETVTPMPLIANGEKWNGLKDVTVNGVEFKADKRSVTVDADVLNGRQWASTVSRRTNTPKTKGQTISVLGWANGEDIDGELRWWIAADGTRYWVGGTAQKPSATAVVTAPADKSEDDTEPVVINGVVFYPLGPDGKGREITIQANGNVREWASTDSNIIGSVKKGDKVFCDYWTGGEEVSGENIWYAVADKDPNNIGSGRLWAGLAVERPN